MIHNIVDSFWWIPFGHFRAADVKKAGCAATSYCRAIENHFLNHQSLKTFFSLQKRHLLTASKSSPYNA
jgi:hypothetical protein